MTEEETGLEGAMADDADAEYVRSVCERDIVGPETTLARYLPLLRWLLSAPATVPPSLQVAAALTFTRFSFDVKHMLPRIRPTAGVVTRPETSNAVWRRVAMR